MAEMIPSSTILPSLVDHPSREDVANVPPVSAGDEDNLFVEARHPNTVLQGLDSMRLNNSFCDLTLCCGGQEFPCHRNVLASFSLYFQRMFSSSLKESRQERVAINGVEPQMVGMLVTYAYTSKILISDANVQALLAAANLLDFMVVRDACCQFMERGMGEMNCVGIHCFAEAHSCQSLARCSMDYILKHFSSVYQQEEFLCLCSNKLIEIIGSDHLNVPKEDMVFEAVLLWLNECDSRKQSFEQILEHIRLPHVNPYYLHDVIEALDAVKENPGCQRLISEAKDYLLLKDRRGELYSCRARPRRSFETAEIIVTVGGEDDKVVYCSVEYFNPVTNQWNNMAFLPFAVSRHGLVASDSTLYLAGGEFSNCSASQQLWKYDLTSNGWMLMAPMKEARTELGLVMLDGYVVAVGGWDGRSHLASVECYNPHMNTWMPMQPIKMAVTSPAVVALDGLLYVAGGAPTVEKNGTDLFQVYNPKTCVWTDLAPLLLPCSGSSACTLKGKIYVIGGMHLSAENTNMVECYNPKTNKWTMRAPMKERRHRPGVAVVDGKIYVLGGYNGLNMFLNTIERYCDETDTWELIGEMLTSRSWHSCVSLQLRKDFYFDI